MPSLAETLSATAGPLIAPGVYDAFTAFLATDAGFDTLYVSGASIAYTKLGSPDIGLVSVSEVAETIALINDRTDASLIVDADTGFGNALNVQRTVRSFERAGASAIQIEDQSFPKRCGHLAGKKLVSCQEMVGKVMAAADARHAVDTLIVARTDAIAVEGIESAFERAERYLEAGADILFIEAPGDAEQLAMIGSSFGERVPLLANMVEGGRTPAHSAAQLGNLGFRVVIFPGGIVRAILVQAQRYFESLKRHGSNKPFASNMADFDGLNRVIGLEQALKTGAKYGEPGS